MSDWKAMGDALDFQLTDEQTKLNLELIAALKSDPSVLKWMQENHLPLKLLDTHPWKIKDWVNGLKRCEGCFGLNTCKQRKKGYLDHLKYDGMVMNVQMPCRYREEKEEALRHRENYLVCDLSEDQLLYDFAKIDTSKEDGGYQMVFTRAMEACEKDSGLYLWGTLGTGKTYLAACASNFYAKQGKKVAFVHYPSFTQRMVSSIEGGEYKTELQRLMYAKLLVLDDIGAESVTEWNRDQILLPLLNYRYEHHLATWFTSNESLETLFKHFQFTNKGKGEEVKAARILERIEMLSQVQSLTGKDRRKFL